MTVVIKPLPDSPLHKESDASLAELIKYFRDDMQIRVSSAIIEHHTNKINDIFSILGYRCAVEYLEKYGD